MMSIITLQYFIFNQLILSNFHFQMGLGAISFDKALNTCTFSFQQYKYHIFVREHGVHAGPKDYFVVVVVVVVICGSI
jgi:hypothetical protein